MANPDAQKRLRQAEQALQERNKECADLLEKVFAELQENVEHVRKLEGDTLETAAALVEEMRVALRSRRAALDAVAAAALDVV
jgi:hypothetical protein